MVDLIRAYDEVKSSLKPNGGARSLDGVKIDAPLLPTRNIMCVGKNYHAHAHELTKSGFDSSAKDAILSIMKNGEFYKPFQGRQVYQNAIAA